MATMTTHAEYAPNVYLDARGVQCPTWLVDAELFGHIKYNPKTRTVIVSRTILEPVAMLIRARI